MKSEKNKYIIVYSFAKLIRIENLILMSIVLYVSNTYIFKKELVSLPLSYLIILILSTIFIAAGGYIINDYFDLKIDKINKPNEVILERTIHRKAGILWHLFFSVLGLIGGIYLAYKVQHLSLAIVQLVSVFLLLIYSNVLKKIFTLGNLTISLLSGLLPILPYIYANLLYPYISIITTNALVSLSIFAFFTTLIRELIKDIQDVEGDIIGDRETIPVAWGMLPSKVIVFFLLLLLIIFLIPFTAYYYMHQQYNAVLYNVLFLIFPAIIQMFLLIYFKDPKKFYILSIIMKFIMLFGILFYLLF